MEPFNYRHSMVNRYIEKKITLCPSGWLERVLLLLCSVVFLMLTALQKRVTVGGGMQILGYPAGIAVTGMALCGVLAQVQTLISVYLTISTEEKGYIMALLLNGLQVTAAFGMMLRTHDSTPAMGITVAVCTIVTISVIHMFCLRIRQKYREAALQQEKMTELYREVAAAEAELERQNRELAACNLAMSEKEERLCGLAYYDVLTKLPNRETMISTLNARLSDPVKYSCHFCMAFFDLDNFKKVNDTMGHHKGDLLLKKVVARLREAADDKDMLARLGGDEFAIVIWREPDEKKVFEYVEMLRKTLHEPFEIDGSELTITASFGISQFPRDGSNVEEILQCADTAMYKAKERGKNAVEMFTEDMKKEILQRIELERHLGQAIGNGELFLLFQPLFYSSGIRLRGFEVLTRWNSSALGPIGPDKFIPVAEETRLIIPMGEWILRTACTRFKAIQEQTGEKLVLSVNISAVQVMEPSFLQTVQRVIEETGFDPRTLEIEMTESVFITSTVRVTRVLERLKQLGVRVALDDFGIGYSSLSYLQKLPIDTLKIDRSFTAELSHTNRDQQIVGLLISLVHRMGIEVVAEGVENETQMDFLKEHDCDYFQGFLLGKPMVEEELVSLIERSKLCAVY